jgi:dihydrofolate reductase
MSEPKISLIAALSENRVIGKGNKLPWHIAEDLKRFKQLTLHHPVIMGRKTFESIGRLLPDRMNIVISRDPAYRVEGAVVANSLEQAIAIASQQDRTEVFVIGGGQIFKEAITIADRLYLTLVHTSLEGDAFFPEYTNFTTIVSEQAGESNGYSYTFLTLER